MEVAEGFRQVLQREVNVADAVEGHDLVFPHGINVSSGIGFRQTQCPEMIIGCFGERADSPEVGS